LTINRTDKKMQANARTRNECYSVPKLPDKCNAN